MDIGAPAHESVPVRFAPELAHESTQEEMLRQAHARVRRHLESAHLNQSQAAAAALRREKLVDAELGTMRVAAGVDKQVPEETVHQPGSYVGVGLRRQRLGTRACPVSSVAA